MSARLSVRKLKRLLERTRKAYDEGKELVYLKPDELLSILKHLRSLHWALRDVQLTLLRMEHSMDADEMVGAADDCLAFIEDAVGDVQTLFEDISEIEED